MRSFFGAPFQAVQRIPRSATYAVLSGVLAASSVADAQQLEEILVTAERRETALQDTPISVMAFSGETLELRGITDMFELATITPNLDIKGSRGTGDTSPTYQIRGITSGGGATGERSVGFYLDNVFMPRSTGPVMRMLDVERVEVLRGPQGTLFGRNSTGGAIRVFSQQPGPENDGYLRVTGGNFDHYDVSGMINVPLTDQIYLRAQGAYLHQDGFVERGPQSLGSSEDNVARLQLAWRPSDALSVTFSGLHTDTDSEGSATDMIRFNMDPACPFDASVQTVCWQGNYADWVSDFLEQSGQARLQTNDPRLVLDDYTMPDWCFLDGPDPDWDEMCRQWNKSRYSQLDATVDWEISDRISLVSTTGLSDFTSSGVSDWQLLGMEFRPSTVLSEVFYQELQFNFSLGSRVTLVAGLNYFDETSSSPREALYNAVGSSAFNATTGGLANGNLWGCAVGGANPPFCNTGERRLRVTGDSTTEQDATAYGIFASGTIDFTERVGLTVGVRQSYDEKEFTNTQFASDNFIPQNGVSTTVSAEDDWSDLDWRATLDFDITDDFMVYVTSSKAFRAGTFAGQTSDCSVPAPPGPPQRCGGFHIPRPPAPVPPEKLLNQELGFRSEWLDGRLRFNATYYEMDFTDRQSAQAVPDALAPTGFVIRLQNSGDIDLWGNEIEAMFAVTDRFTLEGATGRANYTLELPCANNGPFMYPPPMDREYSLSGRYEVPAQTGNFTVVVSYAHTGPMPTHSGGFTPEEQARFGCSDFQASFIDSRYEVPPYDLVNATVRYTSNSGRWSASLYGNNLTDEVYANNAQSFGRGYWTVGGPGGVAGISAAPRHALADYRGRPREYGLTFQYNFY
jgi:iron complex outermembrane receptor protein